MSCNAACRYADAMLRFVMLRVIMLTVVMLSFVIPNVVMLIVGVLRSLY